MDVVVVVEGVMVPPWGTRLVVVVALVTGERGDANDAGRWGWRLGEPACETADARVEEARRGRRLSARDAGRAGVILGRRPALEAVGMLYRAAGRATGRVLL